MKILLKLVGVVLLLILFWVVYQSVKITTPTDTETQETASTQSSVTTVGREGGFHLFQGWSTKTQDNGSRIEIRTSLNRSSVLEDIETPLTETRLEDNVLTVVLHDTAADTNFGSFRPTTFPTGPIAKIEPDDLKNPDDQILLITLRDEGEGLPKFKLSIAPENPGNLILDVLK